MKVSLQTIEDYYYRKGLRGHELRKATERDKEYMKRLREKRFILTKQFRIKPLDKIRYVLSTDQDFEILGIIYKLENKRLSGHDKDLIKLIRTQLEHHWRTPILKFLSNLGKKYKLK